MKKVFLLSTVVFLLTSCSASIPTIQPNIQTKPSITTTPISSATKEILLTPTAIFSTTPTPFPTLTITPTPEPLSANGPWLFFKNQDQERVIANWDGSGRHIIPSPPLPGKDWGWHTSLSPHGGYLLFRPYQDIATSLDESKSSFEYQMIVMKLPEMEVIHTIPLLSDAAKQSMKTQLEEFRKQGYYALPALWGVAQDSGASLWSPDGRYLAFSAAIDGEYADIYLFDTKENTIKRLTHNQHEAIVWDWSPDSKWIVYQEARIYGDRFLFLDIQGVWAVSLNGEIKRLYIPKTEEYLGGWMSAHQSQVKGFPVVSIALG